MIMLSCLTITVFRKVNDLVDDYGYTLLIFGGCIKFMAYRHQFRIYFFIEYIYKPTIAIT